MNPTPTVYLEQRFPNFFVRGTLQGYFKWTRNPARTAK